MLDFLKTYAVAVVVFFVIDIIWLAFIAKDLYRQELEYIKSSSPNWLAAIIFYFLFVLGLVYFVIYPGIESGNLLGTLLTGMFFGLITYATYDLTNLATLEGWPLKITIIDLFWGTSLGGLVSLLTFILYSSFLK